MSPEMEEMLRISDAVAAARGGLGAISLRDWFAGQALLRLAGSFNYESVAESAYKHADAMLEAREKTSTN